MNVDMIRNKKPNQIVSELFTRGRKYWYCFYHTISYYSTKISSHYLYTFFIMKVSDKEELQQIAFNHSSNINLKQFMNSHKK